MEFNCCRLLFRKKKLFPKGKGSSLMISGFQCECHGFFSGQVGETSVTSYRLFEAGVHREGWFTNDDLVAQTKDVIPLARFLHPDCVILFAFDNSMTHHKRAPDGLQVSDLLPLKDNGKNAPIMRNSTFINRYGEVVPQCMVTATGNSKGIKRILNERGLWRIGMTLECPACKDEIPLTDRRAFYVDEFGGPIFQDDHSRFTDQCCARGCLRRQPDFAAQKEWLREVIEEAGCMMIFYPKFHCEFNFIELTWGYMKSHLRRHCTFNFRELKVKIDELLRPGGIPLDKIQSFARFCFRFMDGYRKGLSGPILDYTLKKCKKHRSIPDDIVARVQGDNGEFAKYAASKQRLRIIQ